MKKLLIVLLILGVAAPAMAAEVTFSGSTWVLYSWSILDKDATGYADDAGDFDGNNNVISIPKGGKSNTITANAKASDTLSAEVTIGLGPGRSDSDENAYMKVAEADWNFGAGHLKFGWMNSPASNMFGFPVYIDAGPWIGNGNSYQGRSSTMELDFGGFKVALRENGGIALGSYTDVDLIFPQIAASYTFVNKMLFIKGTGNFQTWTIEDHVAEDSKTVNAYHVSLFGRVRFGPANVGIGGYYGANSGNMGFVFPGNSVRMDGNGDIKDDVVMGVALAGGFKISPKVSLAAGVNHITREAKDVTDVSRTTNAFIDATLGIGPIQFIPEIGYKNMHDYNGVEQGTMIYFTGLFRVFW